MFCMFEEIKEIFENMKKKEWMKCKWHNNSLSHQKLRDFNLSKFFLLFIWKPLQPLAWEKLVPSPSLLEVFSKLQQSPKILLEWALHEKIYCYHFSKLKNSNNMNLWKLYFATFASALFCFPTTHWYNALCSHSIPFHWMSLFVLIFLLSSYQVQPQIISLENIPF